MTSRQHMNRVVFPNLEKSSESKPAKVFAHQQEKEWSCSAACLKAVARFLGKDLTEDSAISAIGAKEGRGAETTDIVNGARKLGFEAEEGSFPSLAKAKEALGEGCPIIADVQSFNYPGKGHYVVIVGFKPGAGFIIMDPNTKGKTAVDNWRVLPEEKLEEIWWDRAMDFPHQMMKKWGIVVRNGQQEKTASGDMMEYFQKNPKKLEEYRARQAAKKKYKSSAEGKRNHAAWLKRKATMNKQSGDILGMGAKRRAKAESARFHQNHYKYAAAQMNGFVDELEKVAAESAIPTAARMGAYIGGARGLWQGAQPDEQGQTNMLSATGSGVAKGALIGALLALGLERNAEGKTTLPRPDVVKDLATKSKGKATKLFKFLKSL